MRVPPPEWLRGAVRAMVLLSVLVASAQCQAALVNFNLTATCETPEETTVVLFIQNAHRSVPMTKLSEHRWQASVNIQNPSVAIRYKYCRDYEDALADEEWEGREQGLRTSSTPVPATIQDTLAKWRWLPVDGVLPVADTAAHLSAPPPALPSETFFHGIEFSDYWWPTFASTVVPTLDKVEKSTNAGWIYVTVIPEVTQFQPEPIVVRVGQNGTPDSELLKIIEEAHRRGLKVFLRFFPYQINSSITDTEAGAHSTAWWNAFERQWRPILTFYSLFAQENGVEMIGFCYCYMTQYKVSASEVPIVDPLALALMKDVKAVFKGPVAFELDHTQLGYATYGDADFLNTKLWDVWPLHLSESLTPALGELVTNARRSLDANFLPAAKRWGKKILLAEISAASSRGSVNGSVNFETQQAYFPEDPKVPYDFQVQADVYEAMLQAISERDWIVGAFSFGYSWWGDSIDKTPSIRSKPAEKVLAKWWSWIQRKPDRFLPSSAHAAGLNGAFYTTDLTVANVGSGDATLTMKFLGNNEDGTAGPERSFALAHGKSATFADLLGSVFSLPAGWGAVGFAATSSPLVIVGQTSTPGFGGTFGQSVPAPRAQDLIRSTSARSIVAIREDAAFRSNLILSNTEKLPVDVDAALIGSNGAVIGQKRFSLPPLGMTQVSRVARELGATDDVTGARILLSTPTPGGAVAAYASVIDNVTNDPRTVLPTNPIVGPALTSTWLLPSSAHAGGANGSFYTTDLTVANSGTADAVFTLKFLGNNLDGTSGPERTFTAGAGKSVTLFDVLGSVFGLASGYGAVGISSPSPFLNVVGQSSTPGFGGTFGQSVPAAAQEDLITTNATRSIIAVREDSSFRTNLILANASVIPVDVDVVLIGGDGVTIGQKRYPLPPLGMTQVSRVAGELGAHGDVVAGRLVLTTPTVGGSFAAYASAIDNVTNDPRTLLPR